MNEIDYARFFDLTKELQLIISLETNIIQANPAFLKLIAVPIAEVRGVDIRSFINVEDIKTFDLSIEKLKSGIMNTTVEVRLNKEKTRNWIIFECVLKSDLIYLTGNYIFMDPLNSNKEMDQFLKFQKMEIIGKMAGGIAHDFNNYLTAILGHSELLLLKGNNDPEITESVEMIKSISGQAANIINQLLTMSRNKVIDPIFLDVNKSILNISRMLKSILQKDIELEIYLCEKTPFIRIDNTQFEQVILNMVMNAEDAMPNGGKLEIQTSIINNSYGLSIDDDDHKPQILISIRDTGSGMSAETMEKIFEPFYTTKEIGKGTGLGLAMSHSIITQSGGDISVISEIGVGTEFRIFLPIISHVNDEPIKAGLIQYHELIGKTILIIDDSTYVLNTLFEILSKENEVLLANQPSQALDLINDDSINIDIILTDLILPQMNGSVLAHKIKQIKPGQKILFMTGYSMDSTLSKELINKNYSIIEKPFSIFDLKEKIYQELIK
ncbi:MAG: ATP-binding protein [Candidatus Heimdallarchaeota archaeon]|nr:ATP-binding protein [Candidatus Heimdallarchaeota archaeon]